MIDLDVDRRVPRGLREGPKPGPGTIVSASRYVIVGGGLAAAAAVEGIREHDRDGSILLLTRENHAPYRRPLLTKDVWFDSEALARLPVHPDGFYAEHGVRIASRREVVELDPERRVVYDERGEPHTYERLLLATGSRPKRLDLPGAHSGGVRYLRDLEDFFALEQRLDHLQHVTLLGGNFTGIEMAAALRHRDRQVTLIYADEYPLYRVLPRELGIAIADLLRAHGVETVSGETLVEIDEQPEMLYARTHQGNRLATQMVLVDGGAEPQTELAEAAGLATDEGVVVDEHARASHADVFAAGDVAEFPFLALGQIMRLECSDHAEHHGRCAGANMAGATTVYDWIPALWFRVFDLVIHGVGDLNPRQLDTRTVWTVPGREGVVYYLRDEVVRGVVLCNRPDRLDWARDLVRAGRTMSEAEREAVTR
jgi:NADPH-dependent 2,4-dienoyl-CoA reductase/sulfur reductase-like enzyme